MTQLPAIQLNLTDTQNGTAWVQARIYTSDQTWVKTVVTSCPRPGQATVQWDGKDAQGDVMPKGIYLFHLEVAGEGLPGSEAYASDKYRSGYWTWDWLRVVDTRFDTPPGYEQVSPPPKDYQRVWYKLVDSRKASTAFVDLFDPDLNKIASAQGGKEVNGDVNGTVWNYADVPFTAITTGGEYVLLVAAKDDDGQWDKAHRQRWALPHNVKNYQVPVVNIANTKAIGLNTYARAEEAWKHQKAIKYNQIQGGKVIATYQYLQNPKSRCVMRDITGQQFLIHLQTQWLLSGSAGVAFGSDTNAIVFLFGHGPGDKNPKLGALRGKIIFTSKNSGVALDANDAQLTAAIQSQYPGYSIAYLSSLNPNLSAPQNADYCRLVVLVGCNIANDSSKDLIDDIVDRLKADAGIAVGMKETQYLLARWFCDAFWQALAGYDEKQDKYTGNLMTIAQAKKFAVDIAKDNADRMRLKSDDFEPKMKGWGVNKTLSPPWWGVAGK